MPSLIVLDDVELFRRQVVVALEQDPTIEVVAELASVPEAVAVAAEVRPDVVVVAVSTTERAVAEAVTALAVVSPTTRVVLLHTDDDDERALAASLVGAVAGVVERDRAFEELAELVLAG